MPHQVRNDPAHRAEIGRRRLDRAQRQPGRIQVSTERPPTLAEIAAGTEPEKIRRTFLTAATGGYRVSHANTPANRRGLGSRRSA